MKEESSVSFEYNAKQEDFDVKQGHEFDIEMVGDVVTQSAHIVGTNFLEEMIEDAKINKVIVLYGFLIYDIGMPLIPTLPATLIHSLMEAIQWALKSFMCSSCFSEQKIFFKNCNQTGSSIFFFSKT